MLYSVKNFVLTFLVSIVIFGVIAYFVTSFIKDTMSPVLGGEDSDLSGILASGTVTSNTPPKTDEWGDPIDDIDDAMSGTNAVSNPSDPLSPDFIDVSDIKGTSFNVLLIGTDYRPDVFLDYLPSKFDTKDYGYGIMSKKFRTISADTVILVRVDKERRQFTFTSFPANMRLFIGTQYTTLGKLYTDYGADYITSKVTALTGIPVDYYAVLNIGDMPLVMKTVGSVEMDIPNNIYFYENKYISSPPPGIDLTPVIYAGKQTINEKNVSSLLMFNDYADEITGRMNVFVTLAHRILGNIASDNMINQVNNLYSALESAFKTNMTLTDIVSKIDLIACYSKFEHVNISYPGTDLPSDDEIYFNPNINEALKKFLNYRGLPPISQESSETSNFTSPNSQ